MKAITTSSTLELVKPVGLLRLDRPGDGATASIEAVSSAYRSAPTRWPRRDEQVPGGRREPRRNGEEPVPSAMAKGVAASGAAAWSSGEPPAAGPAERDPQVNRAPMTPSRHPSPARRNRRNPSRRRRRAGRTVP
jgi:hypothetical protein